MIFLPGCLLPQRESFPVFTADKSSRILLMVLSMRKGELEYGNMGIWEYGNMGIWEYPKVIIAKLIY